MTRCFDEACDLSGRAIEREGLCSRCELEENPTPLSRWMADTDTTLTELAEATGLARQTLTTARAGRPVARATAQRIHEATGVPVGELIDGRPK